MIIIDSHMNLYIQKVEDFCKVQQLLLKYLQLYKNVKEGSLTEAEVDYLYEELNSDDEYGERYAYETYGSKIKFLEYETLRLIGCYKEDLPNDVEISLNRLDVLIGLIAGVK